MKICPLLRVACALSSPGTALFWNCEKPVTMPLTDSLPNGPASKVAGGSHCSGPVRTKVESGAGAAAAPRGAAQRPVWLRSLVRLRALPGSVRCRYGDSQAAPAKDCRMRFRFGKSALFLPEKSIVVDANVNSKRGGEYHPFPIHSILANLVGYQSSLTVWRS